MSLPCQKPKSRFLRLMSEFQKSSKRGGSLVVETGFPTSLIHLFVKNRDRLKKSSSKRVKRQSQTVTNASPPFHSDVTLEKPAAVKTVSGVLTAKNEQVINNTVGLNSGGGSSVCVLMVLMVLVVAVLALSTKKNLTVAITLSTFALLLTEIAAVRVFTRSKICNSDTQKVKPVVTTIHDKNVISCETFDITKPKETEPLITEKSNLKYFTIRDLLEKDEKVKSKSSWLKSKIVKKLRSYKKKKETIKIKEESLTEVSTLVSEIKSEIKESDEDKKESKKPLIRSKGDNMNGIVLVVIVLTGLLSGKILAIGLTLSCLFLRFKAAKKIWSL